MVYPRATRARYDPVVKPLMTCWTNTSRGDIAVSVPQSSLTLHGRTDALGVDELAIFDRPAHHVRTVRITILVKTKLAGHPLKILCLAYGLQDGGTVLFASPLDGIEGDNARLVSVHRPADGFGFVCLQVIFVEALTYIGGELIG